VLINGVSIGGGDDTAALDASDTLVARIKDLGGKRMVDVQRKPVEESGDHDGSHGL
jgi:hypothetical protein